ncbi:hypothetical protein AMEX_G11513 [Astyanax mexicanus]|uniref:Ig-like domain-containing protein n=1 Tax=Astyanax mexicanus TaxID=7994 RepID=A0A8T2LT08_ASTMX|nr:hypothetical protein AMEX_G11513 [Astyanax mexicanus]
MWRIVYTISIAFTLTKYSAADETPDTLHLQKYALLGSTVSLSLQGHTQDLTDIKWRKGKLLVANSKSVRPKFIQKFHLNATDSSLIIKNLTMNDSDHYRAEAGEWEKAILDYHLIVERMVSKPIIETNRNQTAVNSTDDCQISVKCSVDDESVMYVCENRSCTSSQTQTQQTKVNITVAVTDSRTVECTASNHVSTMKTSLAIGDTCSEKIPAENKSSFSLYLAILIGCVIVGIIVVCLPVIVISRKKPQQKDSHPEAEITTVYSVVNKPRISTDTSAVNETASTVYDVPSKRAVPLQSASVQMPQETREQPLEGQPVTANAETEEESANDPQLTVYWKLGQK